jgi:hypothetical protein
MSQVRLLLAIAGIERARSYTNNLLRDLSPEDWFWHPDAYPTHIAWQVGHIAYAQYAHCFYWIRGRRDVDQEFMTDEFIALFEMGTVPGRGAAGYPSIDAIHRVLDDVHQRALSELRQYSDEELDVPLHPSRPDRTRLGGLFWDAEHEFLHAGQIGMLRRLMGKPPVC